MGTISAVRKAWLRLVHDGEFADVAAQEPKEKDDEPKEKISPKNIPNSKKAAAVDPKQ